MLKLGDIRRQAYKAVATGLRRGTIEHSMPAIERARDLAAAGLCALRTVRRIQRNRDANHSEWVDHGGEA